MAHISNLIDRSVQQLTPDLDAGAIRVLRDVSRDVPPVRVDADKMMQVLVNVLKNAVEVSRRGGQIQIRAREDRSNGGAMLDIVITDQGPGISERNRGRLFQPFFTTKKKGTGLGLCIVKKIVDAHGGGVAVSSAQGQGASVRLALPVDDGGKQFTHGYSRLYGKASYAVGAVRSAIPKGFKFLRPDIPIYQ